ncbi:hypothetical protein [Paenibacillus pedocola]|uniref:hypothetical protein n=1 Tax=Paenibacillus pedocola TaxID=3242193 RepID=UPI0028775464|nr:hypothetical protein [Paenibacillus typhae]
MTIYLLIKAIQAFLENELADDGATVPAVHLGHLPKEPEEPAYPFIIIRPAEGEGDKDSIKAQIKLLFGTQAEEGSGLIDLLNLMERVRILLMRERIIAKQFAIDVSWKWKLSEEQPLTEWTGEVTTTWVLPQIRREVEL